MKKTLTILFLSLFLGQFDLDATIIINPATGGGFETAGTFAGNGWTVVNDGNNQWYCSGNEPTGRCNGARGAYIDNNFGAGNNNNYANQNRVSHFYQNFTVPAGESAITLSFNWHALGENPGIDYMCVYVVSTATTPVAGTAIPFASAVSGVLNGTTGCNAASFTLNPAYAGTTQRLVISWISNNSTNNPPGGMIDDISLISSTPSPPGCSVLTSPANGAANVCNGAVTLTWNAPTTGGTPTGYLLYFGTNNLPTNIVNGTNIGNVLTYNAGSLAASTTYYWYVVPTNASGNAVGCSGTVFSFTTIGCYTQTPGGNYSACGGTFYDSGGASADYSDSENSATTICPSTPGQFVSMTFTSFTLESCCDFLNIYNGNTTGAPLMGTFTGTTAPCNITSTAANGCLTFEFTSDISVVYAGWAATISCVAAPPAAPAGSTCSNAPAISLPYTATGQTTACYGNDYNNLSTGSCGTLYESGEDHVYALTVASAQCISISLTNCSSANIGYQVYSGCPGSVGTTCIGNNGGSSPLSGSVILPAAGTYYIVVDSWSAPSSVSYDIAVTSLGTGPINDLPCNPTPLALNANLTGDNSCSGNTSEPATPACWGAGAVNTVWYRITCPASGQLTIRTSLGSLSNTQIALYSGTCGALTLVACNDDAPACGTSTYLNSQITATGLVSGNNYWVAVDGVGNLTGTFDIMAVDGTVGFPAAAGQDCGSPNPVCAQNIAIGNPGYQAYGNICDFPGTTICLSSGERGSAWYTIPINAAGNLEFDIVPNDYTGGSGCCSTDYDFAIWKVAGSGSTTCAGIAAGAVPIRCNYSGLGVTGCFGALGNSPAAYPGYNGSYETQIAVVAGEVYELVISNFSNSTSGFALNFSAGSPINYTAAGSSINWTGGTNTSWALPSNWGGCAIPACGIDATITPSSSNQPILPAGNYYVNNITISAGATLTLQAGANLHVCGNFTNSGSLVADPASTITFDNAAVNQNISGSLAGADKVGNLVVTKTGGSLTFVNNIDIGGSFTTTNGTSVANFNSRYVRIAGNFNNFNGGTTVTNTAAGVLEFNGTGAQTYNQGASTLTLNHVTMLHTGTGVTLATNMVLGTSGILTLTSGKIITGAPREVQVTNNASAACTAGNATSYVEGNLRRYLNGAATSYDFPVGHAVPGYQRANITFTTATTIPQLVARFDTWSPIVNGPAASECPSNTYNALNALDNGYWTITASANPASGNYNTSLYSTNYTNSGGAAGWTVMKAATIAGPWGLNGTCVGSSTPPLTQRTGMNGFSVFAVAQSVQPLPVELTEFSGTAEADYNHLVWTTASETGNDYFTIERSTDGLTFVELGRVDGAGNSTQLLDYYFNDMNPAEGINYYRLKQTDFNGQSSRSSIISLEFHRGNMSVNNIRPNPTNGEVNFDFASPEETEIHFVITDVTGRVVADEYRKVKAGVTAIGTLIAEEGAGIYSLKVIEEKHGFISVSRIVKY